MSKPQILVTGGAGYVGSHTCKALAKAGYDPIVIDDLSSGLESFVQWGELIVGDIEDTTLLKKIFNKYDIQAVMHFASLIDVSESVRNPILYYKRNVIPSLRLIETMREFKIKKMIFSSTCAIYGTPDKVPIGEDTFLAPLNPYGKTKWTIENLLSDMALAGEMSAVSLRYFNASGADPDCQVGEAHDPETHLIPLVIRAAFDPSYTLKVFGTNYPTTDGTCIRDYVHVTDLAQAHVLALKSLTDEPGMECYNVGSEKGYSVLEILKVIERVTGRQIKHTLEKPRPGDPAVLVADSHKIKNRLQWSPKYSDLETIVKTAVAWHQKEK